MIFKCCVFVKYRGRSRARRLSSIVMTVVLEVECEKGSSRELKMGKLEPISVDPMASLTLALVAFPLACMLSPIEYRTKSLRETYKD